MNKPYLPEAIQRAKKLRKKSTNAETILWSRLRDRRFNKLKFKRQQPIGSYIVDFCCKAANLIIELDGGQHNSEKKIEYDQQRTDYLENQGFKVIRFWNSEISYKDIDQVLSTIYEQANLTSLDLIPLERE